MKKRAQVDARPADFPRHVAFDKTVVRRALKIEVRGIKTEPVVAHREAEAEPFSDAVIVRKLDGRASVSLQFIERKGVALLNHVVDMLEQAENIGAAFALNVERYCSFWAVSGAAKTR